VGYSYNFPRASNSNCPIPDSTLSPSKPITHNLAILTGLWVIMGYFKGPSPLSLLDSLNIELSQLVPPQGGADQKRDESKSSPLG
jgi:hypothetical protein